MKTRNEGFFTLQEGKLYTTNVCAETWNPKGGPYGYSGPLINPGEVFLCVGYVWDGMGWGKARPIVLLGELTLEVHWNPMLQIKEVLPDK